MPVILEPDIEEAWLNSDEVRVDIEQAGEAEMDEM
jgi:hypothetical protein